MDVFTDLGQNLPLPTLILINTSGFIKQHVVFRRNWETYSEDYKLFMRNLTEYNNKGTVKHDDAPDALHGLSVMCRAFYSDVWLSDEQ